MKHFLDSWLAHFRGAKPLLDVHRTTSSTCVDCLLIAFALWIPYHQVNAHRFVEFDDGMYIFMNTRIIEGFTWESVLWAFTNMDAANWHPITWLTYFADRELWGPYVGGYMLMNVAWHTLAAMFCYIAFRRVTANRFVALSVALAFALHPGNVENVAWISERKSLLDAFFWFLGIIAYVDYIEGRGRRFYWIVVITHLLGLMSKAMHVTFPCTLVLLHLLHANARGQSCRATLWPSIKLALPLLALSVYFALVTTTAQAPAMVNWSTYPLYKRLVNVILSYGRYLEMFFLPRDFAIFYPLFVSDIALETALWPFLTLCALTAAMIALARRQPVFLLGWLWFLGTMVPVIGLVHVGSQSHADRYLYIPILGLALWAPSSIALLSAPLSRLLKPLWLTVGPLSLIAATWIQVSYWKDGVTLFRHSLSITGDCLTSVVCVTGAYCRNERPQEAVVFIDEKLAVAKNPQNIARLKAIKAGALAQMGKLEAALKVGEEAIAEGTNEAATLFVLASVAYQLDRLDEAEKFLAKVPTGTKGGWMPPSMLMHSQLTSGSEVLTRLIEERRRSAEAAAPTLVR